MADIKNKNELKRRADLFIDEFTHEEYMINEPFCKETMRMVREFIGRACHLLDCKEAQIKKAEKRARAKAIEEFAKEIYKNLTHYVDKDGSCEGIVHYEEVYGIAERLKKEGAV